LILNPPTKVRNSVQNKSVGIPLHSQEILKFPNSKDFATILPQEKEIIPLFHVKARRNKR
jgi:hypothetical protein